MSYSKKWKLLHLIFAAPFVINVQIHPGPDTPRHDNKALTSEQADEIIEHMTEEQRARLKEVIRCRNNGGCKNNTPVAPQNPTQSWVFWLFNNYAEYNALKGNTLMVSMYFGFLSLKNCYRNNLAWSNLSWAQILMTSRYSNNVSFLCVLKMLNSLELIVASYKIFR